jgi:P4 family phage/plasmid primase-like protien
VTAAARKAAVPADLSRFLGTIFQEDDLVLVRPIEVWTEAGEKRSRVLYRAVQYHRAGRLAGDPSLWQGLLALAGREKANLFFGVGPRFGGGQRFDLAWQVRVVRVLWADLDRCTPEESLARCDKAKLPRPSVIVRSGHGVHLYWLLAEPYLVDDAGDPPPAYKEFVDQGEGKKKKVRRYTVDPTTKERNYNLPPLSAKAKHVQQIIKGMAAQIGGDHTQDLSRILRLPATLNRKDERNGKEPVPCVLVECDAERRYPLALFEPFADKAPGAAEEKKAAGMRLPRRKLTPGRLNTLGDFINACSVAEDQSGADWRLCRWAAGQGLDKEAVWEQVKDVSKFARRGREYFDRTWDRAEAKARLSIYRRAQRRAGANATPGANGNGHAAGTPAGGVQEPGADEVHCTDLGNARRLVRGHGADFHHCHPWRRDLVFDGRRWREDDTAQAERWTKDTVRRMYAEAAGEENGDRREGLVQHALESEDAKRLRAMVSLARSEPGVPVLPADLDADPFLFNALNGTIDLRTGRLREHRREDLLTKLAPVEYDPDAPCPLWRKFLGRILDGNEDLVAYLQRVVGYGLTGDVSEQSLWFFHGTGANGKSTFLLTVLAMLGDYGMQAVSDLLLVKNHEAHPTERADLFGRRFVATIETEEGKRLAEALMKQMTGGDKVRARRMRQDFFEFSPTHKIVLAANHKPVIRGTDHAVWRRIKMVPFTVTIPDEEKDKALPEKLKAELPGVLGWAVRGCLDWQRHGLGEPDEVRKATTEYQAEQDTVQGFLNECCFINSDARVKSSALLEAYHEWSGDRLMTAPAFRERLKEKGYSAPTRGTGGAYYWNGLGLQAKDRSEGR